MIRKLKVLGIDCANCARELEEKVSKIEGIYNVSLSFMTELLIYECKDEESKEMEKKVRKVIKKEEPDCEVEEA